MAIAFTTLFTRLGSAVAALNDTNASNTSNRATQAAAIQSYAQTLLAQYVLADRPQTVRGLTAYLTELNRQMVNAAQSLATARCTTTVAAVGSPVGTPTFVTSDLDAGGLQSDLLIPDTLVLQATSTTALSVQGLATGVRTDVAWTVGNNVNTTLTLTDPRAGINQDGSFNTWAGSPVTPSYWTITSGIAGTTVNRVTGGYLDTTYAVEFASTGGLLSIRQDVSTAVTPGSTYMVHAALRKTVFAGGTGTVSVTLRDASGNVLSATGVSQTFTGLTTSFAPFAAAVYVPAVIANGCYLDIRWTGTSGDKLEIDSVGLAALPTLYTDGLRLGGWQGATALTPKTDQWTATTVLASGTMNGGLLKGVDRLIGLAGSGVRIPTSGAPTQADALVA